MLKYLFQYLPLLVLLLFITGGISSAQDVVEQDSVIEEDAVDSVMYMEEEWEDPDEIKDNIVIDSSAYPLTTQFPASFRESYQGDDFRYESQESRNYWQEFLNWLSNVIRKLFSISDETPAESIVNVIKWIVYGTIFLLVAYFIFRFLYNKEGRWIFSKSSRKTDSEVENFEEEMKITDFRKIIQECVQKEEYRLASRYYFVWLLKQLDERAVIHYMPEKTSEEYMAEISNEKMRADYKHALHLYNYIWYGEFFIDKEQFRQVELTFKKLIREE